MRLREFQTQLLERMRAARSGAASERNLLGVMIGQQRWLLSIGDAAEIVQVGQIVSVPLTQPWYLGLANVRGNLVSVIDLGAFQGGPLLPVDRESRLVTLAPSLSAQTGFLVSRVMGLRNIEEMDEVAADGQPMPDAGTEQLYMDRSGDHWRRLDLTRIVQDPRFLQVAQ